MNFSERSNLLINLFMAILGAFLAGYFISSIFKIETISAAITVLTVLFMLLGSLILLAIIIFFRRIWHHPA